MSIALTESKHRYVALDSLRGICACMVILHHIPGPLELVPLAKNAYLFVDFFFVLSGFVIGTSYGERLASDYPVSRYMILRFFRVYPLHFFMLAAYLAFELLFAAGALGTAARSPLTGDYSLSRLVECIFLVQPFMGPDAAPWNGPAWSIATEFWTYLLFALAMKAAPRLIVPICMAIVIAAPILLAFGTDRNMNVYHDGALTRCLFGFAAGVLCWKLPDRLRCINIGGVGDRWLEFATVILCGAFVWFAGAGRLSLAAPAVFLMAVLVFSRERGMVSRWLCSRPMAELGKLSYSIYMVHLFLIWRYLNALTIGERLTGINLVDQNGGSTQLTHDPLVSTALTIILMAGVLVAAWLTNRYVEEPGRALGRRLAAHLSVRAGRTPLPQ